MKLPRTLERRVDAILATEQVCAQCREDEDATRRHAERPPLERWAVVFGGLLDWFDKGRPMPTVRDNPGCARCRERAVRIAAYSQVSWRQRLLRLVANEARALPEPEREEVREIMQREIAARLRMESGEHA